MLLWRALRSAPVESFAECSGGGLCGVLLWRALRSAPEEGSAECSRGLPNALVVAPRSQQVTSSTAQPDRKSIAKYAMQCGNQRTANVAGGPSRDQIFAAELTRTSPSTAAQLARTKSSAPWRRVRLGATQMPSAGRRSRKSSCAGPASRIAAAQRRNHP